MKTLSLPRTVLLDLICEAYELGDLTDTGENIESPPGELTEEGRYIQKCLINRGITTQEEVREFYTQYLEPLIGNNVPEPQTYKFE